MEDYEQTWKEFWESICADDDGNPLMDRIKRELHDYFQLMKNTSLVYEHIAGLSKPNTDPKYIIAAFEDKLNEAYEEGHGAGVTYQ